MKNFLEEHQKILNEILKEEGKNSEKLEKSIKDFLMTIEIAITIYSETADQLSYQSKKFNKNAETLCQLRDFISKLRKGKGDEQK